MHPRHTSALRKPPPDHQQEVVLDFVYHLCTLCSLHCAPCLAPLDCPAFTGAHAFVSTTIHKNLLKKVGCAAL